MGDEKLSWSRKTLLFILISHSEDETSILSSVKIIKFSIFKNCSSEDKRKDVSFLKLISSVIQYGSKFKGEYGVRYLEAQILKLQKIC